MIHTSDSLANERSIGGLDDIASEERFRMADGQLYLETGDGLVPRIYGLEFGLVDEFARIGLDDQKKSRVFPPTRSVVPLLGSPTAVGSLTEFTVESEALIDYFAPEWDVVESNYRLQANSAGAVVSITEVRTTRWGDETNIEPSIDELTLTVLPIDEVQQDPMERHPDFDDLRTRLILAAVPPVRTFVEMSGGNDLFADFPVFEPADTSLEAMQEHVLSGPGSYLVERGLIDGVAKLDAASTTTVAVQDGIAVLQSASGRWFCNGLSDGPGTLGNGVTAYTVENDLIPAVESADSAEGAFALCSA